MYPLICEGDTIIVMQTKDLKPGDIAVYKKGETVISHRVVSVNGNRLKTKPDSQPSCDPYTVDINELIGKVAAILKSDGSVRKPYHMPSAGYPSRLKLSLVNLFRSVSKWRPYNLFIDIMTPFVVKSRGTVPAIDLKRRIFYVGNMVYERPSYALNFYLFGMAVGCVLCFMGGRRAVYLRSPFENSKRIREIIGRCRAQPSVTALHDL